MKFFKTIVLLWGVSMAANAQGMENDPVNSAPHGESELSPEEQKIANFFNALNAGNVERLSQEFYARDVSFEDPMGRIEGRDDLVKYYKHMYENVISIRFDSIQFFDKESEKVMFWKMHLRHKSISSGEPIVVDGVSHLRFSEGKIIYHRDYFDAGKMLYERIPMLGSIVKWIKGRSHDF